MARLKSRSGVETLEIPIEVGGNEVVYSIKSPSLATFDAYKDILDLARAQAIADEFGADAPDFTFDSDAISARLLAYVESIEEGETVESMLIGPDVFRAMVAQGVDPFMRQHVANTIVVWVSNRSTAAAAEFWETGDAPKAPKARRPQDRKKKRRRKN